MSFSNESTNITTFTEQDWNEYLTMKKAKEDKAKKQAAYNERRRISQMLLMKKAKAQGIVVSEEEVDAELAKQKK